MPCEDVRRTGPWLCEEAVMENKFYFFAVGAAYGGQRCNNNYSKFLCQQVGRDGSANQLWT